MGVTQQDVLEELVAPRRESWSTFPSGVNDFFPNGWTFESPFYQNPELVALNSSLLGLISPPTAESVATNFITSPESYQFLDSCFTGLNYLKFKTSTVMWKNLLGLFLLISMACKKT
ncbi:hypothetical protein HAX54_016204 [Datura stramonium]|uniref:Uncharacterized protein n=1 Tax=Datura stramonium TaxID=4076 RepID=A0ABS8UKQ2_DATST|nr:hypothetical protein [Datura stramonium]